MLLVRLIFEYLLILGYLQVYELHRLSFHDPRAECEQETFWRNAEFLLRISINPFRLARSEQLLSQKEYTFNPLPRLDRTHVYHPTPQVLPVFDSTPWRTKSLIECSHFHPWTPLAQLESFF